MPRAATNVNLLFILVYFKVSTHFGAVTFLHLALLTDVLKSQKYSDLTVNLFGELT